LVREYGRLENDLIELSACRHELFIPEGWTPDETLEWLAQGFDEPQSGDYSVEVHLYGWCPFKDCENFEEDG